MPRRSSCRRAALVALAAVALAAICPGATRAESPLVGELREMALRYHEDLPRLDRLYRDLAQVAKTDGAVENWIALAHVSFIWGDVRARTPEEKLEAYDRGREAGKRAAELAPRHPLAHFWLATNAGRWGQTKGVMRSLFLLPTVNEEMQLALELDPKLVGAYSLAGSVYY